MLTGTVMIKFWDQVDRATGCPHIWLNTLGESMRGFLGEFSILLFPVGVGIVQSTEGLDREKGGSG